MISCDDSTLFINIDFYVKWRRYNDDKNCHALSPQSHTHMHTLIHNANKQHAYMYVITCLYTHTHTGHASVSLVSYTKIQNYS